MVEYLQEWLGGQGVTAWLAEYLSWLAIALVVVLASWLANFVAKRFLLVTIHYFIRRTQTNWDDFLLRRRVFARLSHLAPALIIYLSAHFFGVLQDPLQRLSVVYMLLAGALVLQALLNAATDIYETFEISRSKPIKGYVQVVKIIVFLISGLVALAVIMGQKPWLLLSGLGAMTAILLLIFRDSILGLVASVQLSANDMVRIGDWIEMPKFGADGDVIDVSLHTIKVKNWDKTITTIPAYALISDSFRNWRGMTESGGRRIKRAVYIDMSSIKFCTARMLDRFEKYQLITDYIRKKRTEIAAYNVEHNIDTSELINGRNLTNIGTFRAYIAAYLRQHPKIHQQMTFLIRYLKTGELGLPVEIYVFSNDQEWANYEAIMADIFDHILAVVPLFDLRVFQPPTGSDIRTLADAAQRMTKEHGG